MYHTATRIGVTLIVLLAAMQSSAFCGFYVARADKSLYNKASEVVIVRDGDRSVITMNSDCQGDVDEFAMVIPVPTVLEREQIHVTERKLIDHLDAYTAPRLVEYFDNDPCMRIGRLESKLSFDMARPQAARSVMQENALGVTIEAKYTVGEYDILILSAEQSDGLLTWLNRNGYRVPDGAERTVSSYLRQGMRFFVAKVNLEEQAKLGYSQLRPIQVAFESPKFMLPIRLGMINAKGSQEMFVYALTRTGRVETRNYRTVKMPTGSEVPEYVKANFDKFYRAMFDRKVAEHHGKAVMLEYAWDMAWCDPCAADPLSNDELRELGVFWLEPGSSGRRARPQNVFVTRLHVRYGKETFPEDLMFVATGDRSNFQGRYVIRHPWRGKSVCKEARHYNERVLPTRLRREAKTLASLTGWSIDEIMSQVEMPKISRDEQPWWRKLWKDS
jgi:hypothetical protein